MTTMQILNSSQASPEIPVNENFETLSAAAIFGKRQPGSTGLVWAYYGGIYNDNTVVDGDVALTDDDVTYVVVHRATGVVSASVATTNWLDTDNYARLYAVTAAGGAVTATADHRMDEGGLLLSAGGGGSSSFLRQAAAFVEELGDDGSAVLGNVDKPFSTIDAALDALPSSGGSIFIGVGRFAPITSDAVVGGSGLNGSSKLKSYVRFFGSGMPALNNTTAPTALADDSGTIIDGPVIVHSTRHGMQFHDLGIDSGSAVCSARYSGTAADGLGFFNVGQVGSLAPARDPVVQNVICLCKAVNSPVHAICLENVTRPSIENVQAYFGQHGIVLKATGGTANNLHSYGHSENCMIVKESNTGNDTARCHDLAISNVSMGSLAASDTPVGMIFQTASTRDLERIAISGIVMQGITTTDLKTVAESSGVIKNVRLDNLFTDNGAVRTSLHANTEQSSVYVNGTALSGGGGSSAKVIPIACSDETTALTAGTAKVTFRMPYAMTLSAVRASLTTAQSSGSIFTVDINEGGSTILSTKLTIDNTEKTSTTAATAAVISDTALADDAEITIDIDQIGNGTAAGLKVYLIGS